MPPISRALWLTDVLLVVAACGDSPAHLDGGDREGYAWAVAVRDLDEAVLSVCSGGGTTIAVGGRGGHGLVLEWTGTSWYAAPLPDGVDVLWWCWVDDAGQPWAVGESASIVRRDPDGAWRSQESGRAVATGATLFGVWGTSATDVWVVGGLPTGVGVPAVIAHFDGASWSSEEPGVGAGVSLFKVWGAAPDDVWAVGNRGTILHRVGGAAWSSVPPVVDDRLIAVWGRAADDVYAVGGDGTGVILRWDGDAWAIWSTPPEALTGVWTAPGAPLDVAGNRGFVARYDVTASAGDAAVEVRLIAADVDLHALAGVGGALLAAGTDLLGGGASSWHGAIYAHGGDYAGPVVWPTPIDAGLDASGAVDGGAADARADGGADARSGPGPGAPCSKVWPFCGEGLTCWPLSLSSPSPDYLCTQECDSDEACAAYDAACCATVVAEQGFAALCVPGSYGLCPASAP